VLEAGYAHALFSTGGKQEFTYDMLQLVYFPINPKDLHNPTQKPEDSDFRKPIQTLKFKVQILFSTRSRSLPSSSFWF
jgi:hypothetical protein